MMRMDPQQVPAPGAPERSVRMDEKWIPAMPLPDWKNWNTRAKELGGFKTWLEKFCSWLCVLHDMFGPGLKEAIDSNVTIHVNPQKQAMRSRRIFHLVQQAFSGCAKVEHLIRSQITNKGVTDANGYEMIRIMRKEFSLLSRAEALKYRELVALLKPSLVYPWGLLCPSWLP